MITFCVKYIFQILTEVKEIYCESESPLEHLSAYCLQDSYK